jgi:hypothetical protein
MVRATITIDRDKLRAAIRKLGHEYIFYMLDDAIDLLPPAKLLKIAEKYVDVRRLQSDGEKATQAGLLADVKAFEKASLAGEYYETFDVNWKNSMETSTGTAGWISQCHRLLDRCVDLAKKSDPTEIRQAFDIIFGLLDRIDDCREDIIFFADEAGSWQVGVQWEKVLPSWFKVLSATADPDEYAQRIVGLLKRHHKEVGAEMFTVACRVATPEQRQMLSKLQLGVTEDT